jgi:sigma-B regulation protein RsbU (phosphoserine phosphatase)
MAPLEPGDLLLLYSDGLLEARNPQGELLGEEGLLALAQGVPVDSPRAAGQALLTRVDAFRQEAPGQDDETLLALQRPRD